MNPDLLDLARRAVAAESCPELLRDALLELLMTGRIQKHVPSYLCSGHPYFRRWAGAIHWADEIANAFMCADKGLPVRLSRLEAYLRYLSKHLKQALAHEPRDH